MNAVINRIEGTIKRLLGIKSPTEEFNRIIDKSDATPILCRPQKSMAWVLKQLPQQSEMSEMLVWHSVKKEGYPPVYDASQKCEASDLLLLTIQEFDHFKGCVDSFIGLGSYHRDVRDLARRKYPVTGWIDDRGNEIKARVTHWAIAPKPRKENSHAQSNRNRL